MKERFARGGVENLVTGCEWDSHLGDRAVRAKAEFKNAQTFPGLARRFLRIFRAGRFNDTGNIAREGKHFQTRGGIRAIGGQPDDEEDDA